MGKFIRLILGPVHFRTRFLPLIKNNKETLHNYIFLVDNFELYEPYKDLTTILNLDIIRKNHPFSNELEFVYDEKDPEIFMNNFRKISIQNDLLVSQSNVLRFCFLYLYDNNILNFTYNGNNTFMTNKQNFLDDHFNNKPVSSFHAPIFYPANRHHPIIDLVKNSLKEKYPNLIIPEDYCAFDGYSTGFHFKNKEELILFYNIWDYIIGIASKEDKKLLGTTLPEIITGYIIRLFELNFSYTYLGLLGNHWSNQYTGQHLTLAHDTVYYKDGRFQDYSFGDFNINNFNIKNIIKNHKEDLIRYYNMFSTTINYEITEDNIIITLKNL